jgi:hypothetical protein
MLLSGHGANSPLQNLLIGRDCGLKNGDVLEYVIVSIHTINCE